MAVDGSLKFDTKIDSTGFESGIQKVSSMAAKGLAVIGAAIAGASAYAIKVGADFEQGMSKVAAISGVTGDELSSLTEKAKEMGAKTKFSATEASEAMQYMAMAGWKAADMVNGIDGIMNLAAASGEDLASVSDIVTDALTAFGLQAKDSAHFADVLAKASSNSNTNVAMMGATFKYAAPLAGALKYSIEDVALATGLMANAGIKGEQAGTSLRAMFSRLAKPPQECADALDSLNLSIQNSDGSAKPLNQTLQEMREKFSKLSDTQKTQYASAIAGQEAMSGLLAIVNASDTDFDKLSQAISNADGSAEEMAETMQDNLKGQITILGSSLEGLGIQAYEKFEKPLKRAVSGAIDKVGDLSQEMSSGKLSKSMDKCAEGIAGIAEAAIDLASAAIPAAVKGFAFIVDHGKEVITVTAGIAAGFVYYKNKMKIANTVTLLTAAAQKALTIGSLALGTATSLLTGKISLQTAAHEALNLVQMASPQGLLTAAVVAGAAAIGALIAVTIMNRKETDENTIATQKLADEYEKLNTKLKDNKKARDESIASAEIEASSADVLMDKLEDLSKKENKSNSEKAMMKYYVDELNRVMPDLNLIYDEEKDALNKSTQAIRNNIDAQKDLIMAKAYQKNLSGIAEDLAEAQIKLDEANEQNLKNEYAYTEAKKKSTQALKVWHDAGSKTSGEEYDAMMKANSALVTATSNFNKSTETVEKCTKKVTKLNKEFDKTGKYAQNSLDSVEIGKKLSQLITDAEAAGIKIPKALSKAIKSGSYAVPKSIEELQSLITYDGMVKKAKENGLKVPKVISDGIKSGELKPSEAIQQMTTFVEFGDLLEKAEIAGKNVPEFLKNKIIEGQIKPAEAVEQMKQLVKFDSLMNDAGYAGEKVPQILQEQILAGQIKPSEAVESMKRLIKFNDLLSKSAVAGMKIPETLQEEILNGKTKPKTAVEELERLAIEEAGKTAIGMKSAGESAAQGFADGLESNDATRWVTDAAGRLALAASNAAKKKQKSHSPSRLWRDEIGLMAGEGYAVGLEDSGVAVKKSVSNLVEASTNAMKRHIKRIPKFSSEVLLNLKEAASSYNSRSANHLSSFKEGSGAAIDRSVKYEINQTITSPEPLSPYELGEQTLAAMNRKGWKIG